MRSFKLGLLLACAVGCHATFDVEVDSSTEIRGGGLFQELLPGAFRDFASMDLSQQSEFANAGVSKDDVESVRLSSAVLTIAAPPEGTFEFLDEIAFFVEAEGQPKKRLASATGISDDARSIDLEIDDLELAPYVVAPSMTVTTTTRAHAPGRDTTVNAKLVFTVDPKIF